MINNATYNQPHSIRTSGHKFVAGASALVVLAFIALAVTITASANPPSAAEVRIQGWVDDLREDRLTVQRHNAQRELENAGNASVPALAVALRSEDVVLRTNAADMLGFIASPSSTSALEYVLVNDAVPTVRRNAAWALGEINDFSMLDTLERSSIIDPSPQVRQAAGDSLARNRARLALAAGLKERELNAYAVAPGDARVVYAASARNLSVSRDGGATWNTLQNALPSVLTVLAVSPSSTLTLYAGIDGQGMFKSVDGGREWNPINQGLEVTPGARYVVSAVTIDPADPQHLIIATGVMLGTSNVDFFPMGIMVSRNGGAQWSPLNEQEQEMPITRLAIEKNQVYAMANDRVLRYPLN
jgi:hypothetical protein